MSWIVMSIVLFLQLFCLICCCVYLERIYMMLKIKMEGPNRILRKFDLEGTNPTTGEPEIIHTTEIG